MQPSNIEIMFPKVGTISIVPRLFEDLRDETRRQSLITAEGRYAIFRQQSVLVPIQVAEECIARQYVTVGKILFVQATGFHFGHFTGSNFQYEPTGNRVRDEYARAKSLLDASIKEKSSHFLERREVETLRRKGGLETLEMDGLMRLSGFTTEGLEHAGWSIRMH
jgi:hypothetical protein